MSSAQKKQAKKTKLKVTLEICAVFSLDELSDLAAWKKISDEVISYGEIISERIEVVEE